MRNNWKNNKWDSGRKLKILKKKNKMENFFFL